MNILRKFYSNSLRNQTEYHLRDTRPNLFPSKSVRIFNSITLSHSIIWTLGILFFCLILCSLFSFWGIIPINIETAKTLIDQRIGNLASIIGTSLTVATLLINNFNLANKKKEYYEIMFKKTYLRGTVISTLLVFAFLLIISFLKDILSSNYPNFFCNLYGLSYILIFGVLLLIGNLFYNLIHVFDPMFLQKGLKDELKEATRKAILNKVFEAKVEKDYKENIKEALGEKEIPPIFDFFTPENYQEEQILEFKDHNSVVDVKIDSVVNFLKKNKEKLDQKEIHYIGNVFSYSKSQNLYFNKNSFAFKKIKSYFKIVELEEDTLNLSVLLKIMQNDLNKISKSKKNDINEDDLENIFSNYGMIYSTYYDCITKDEHKIAFEFEAIKHLHYDFEFALKEALSNDNKILLEKILNFNSYQCQSSIKYNSLKTFWAYLHIEDRIISSAKDSTKNYTNFIINKKISAIELNVWIIPRFHESLNSTEARPFIDAIFSHWTEFLYDLLENKKFDGFERAVTGFNDQFSNYTNSHNWDIYDLLERVKNKEATFIDIEAFNQENYFPYSFLCSSITIFSWICSKLLNEKDEQGIEDLTKLINLLNDFPSEPENLLIAIDAVYNTERNNNGNWYFVND